MNGRLHGRAAALRSSIAPHHHTTALVHCCGAVADVPAGRLGLSLLLCAERRATFLSHERTATMAGFPLVLCRTAGMGNLIY